MSHKKKWTIELFAKDVLPIVADSLARHSKLVLRESAILTCSIIDLGLAEIISKRLAGPQHEIIDFIGADGDGRAPCGSFGARIQLARLLGILTDDDLQVLRLLKKLRNQVAHRVLIDVTIADTGDLLCAIWDAMRPPLVSIGTFVAGIVDGKPEAISRIAASPDGANIDSLLKELRTRLPQLGELDRQIRALLGDIAEPSWKTSFAIFLGTLFPRLLRQQERAASFMLALLLGLYNARLKMYLDLMSPLPQVGIPTHAIKMWPSDVYAMNSPHSRRQAE